MYLGAPFLSTVKATADRVTLPPTREKITVAPAPAAVADPAAAVRALPWETVFDPVLGITKAGDSIFTDQGPGLPPVFKPDPYEMMVYAFGPGKDVAQANGFSGRFIVDGVTEVIPGESGDIRRVHGAPSPELLTWLKSNGYTVKVASPDSGKKSGADYASLWKGGTLVGVNSYRWSNKPGFVGYLTLGVLGAIAGAAALQAAGVTSAAAGGTGASSLPTAAEIGAAGGSAISPGVTAVTTALPSASGLLPAAAAVAPAVVPTAVSSAASAAAPSVASTIGTTLIKAAPDVVKAISAVAAQQAISKAQQSSQAEIERAAQAAAQQAAQQNPAALPFPTSPTTPGFFAPGGAGYAAPATAASTLPSWVVPAAFGAAVLILLPLLMQPKKGARRAR